MNRLLARLGRLIAGPPPLIEPVTDTPPSQHSAFAAGLLFTVTPTDRALAGWWDRSGVYSLGATAGYSTENMISMEMESRGIRTVLHDLHDQS